MVQMLHSRHLVMVNDAITSLTLMASVMLEKETEETDDGYDYAGAVSSQLHTDAVVNGVKNVLKSPQAPPEMKANCGVFVQTLLRTRTEAFKSMLAEMSFKDECLADVESLPQECADLARELSR